MNIPFIKMHGLGNDFIIFDNINNSIISDKNFIRQIGNRRLGIGCDQLMMIENTSKKDNFKIKMYNSDGSETGACGNGTRCVADYIMNKENLNTVNIETISGELKCSRSENGIKVNMGLPKFSWRDIPLAYETDNLKVALDEFNACCISIGNPHAVIFISNLGCLLYTSDAADE